MGSKNLVLVGQALSWLLNNHEEINVAPRGRHCDLLLLLLVVHDVADYEENSNYLGRSPLPSTLWNYGVYTSVPWDIFKSVP